MNRLVLYYSLSGNNKNLACIISKNLNCPSEQIIVKNKRNIFTLIIEMITKKMPQINDIKENVKDYDHIVMISPIWGGVPATPMISFIKKYSDQIKDYSFISLSGGSLGPNKNLSKFLQNKFGKKPSGLMELFINDIASNENKNKPSRIMKLKIDSEDIDKNFREKILNFISLIYK